MLLLFGWLLKSECYFFYTENSKRYNDSANFKILNTISYVTRILRLGNVSMQNFGNTELCHNQMFRFHQIFTNSTLLHFLINYM